MAVSDTSDRRKSFKLCDFVECYKLPVCAKVVGYRTKQSRAWLTPIKCGDFICLQTLAVDHVVLSFYDADTGSKREVRVPADSNMKFNVVSDSRSGEPELSMPTVADVIDVCPMKFRANTACDDPYMPIIFKKGEIFRYLRKSRCPNDGTIYLECEDASGNVLQLPRSCKGDFNVIDDETSYSLREIISFGPVSRKLKLSSENIKLIPVKESEQPNSDDNKSLLYANVENNDGTLSRITGLPLTFNGVITMRAPDLFLLASPINSPDERWKVPLGMDIDLIMCTDNEYEEPVKIDRDLSEFISDLEQDLPLIAKISKYEQTPCEFKNILKEGSDIIVFGVETSEKILTQTQSQYFCIGKQLNGRFRKTLRRFTAISELAKESKCITVKIMEDIASDVPEPISLKIGDILKFESFDVQTVKIRFGKKNIVKCETISCEKFGESDTKTLRLPLDFEVSMIEILSEEEQEGCDIESMFSKSTEFPVTVDFLPIDHCSQSVLPFDRELELLQRVSDPLVLVSPLQVNSHKRVSGLDAKVGPCLLVPVRHKLFLKLKNKLHFPPNYFRLPNRDRWLNVNAEMITEETFHRLVKYNDQAYEDYDPRTHAPKADTELESLNDSSKRFKQLRRIGASMATLPHLRKHSKNLQKTEKLYKSEGNLVEVDTEEAEPHTQDDERIYELYEAPSRKDENKKQEKTIKGALMKRLSLRRKKNSKS